MNIKEAKEYIKDSIKIYLKKDEFGDYIIPVERQRPIFLVGAPGIGKTAIIEQIAQEMGIALVSYSMTHHTRQSALGLPFISKMKYENKEFDVSRYTMSEIISSIYETMNESGIKEGILFLDEINCVSETLAPSMLQFLQYKVFGKHPVPEGWVIVTAGNPPEYNKSVKEFDVVTLDRLKVLDVTACFETWKEYALYKGIHQSIISFLEMKKEYFYQIQTTHKGKSYVTARGWEDLSDTIYMYEEEKLTVSDELIEQYIRNEKVVKEFSAYYVLYNRYKEDYKIEEILNGRVSQHAIEKAQKAQFDERISLLGIMLQKMSKDIKNNVSEWDLMKKLKEIITELLESDDLQAQIEKNISFISEKIENQEKAKNLSSDERWRNKSLCKFLKEQKSNPTKEYLRKSYQKRVGVMKKEIELSKEKLHNLFEFVEKAMGETEEMLILVTELTVNVHTSRFIGMFGSEDYNKYNELLMVSTRHQDLRKDVEQLIKDLGI